MRSFEVINYLNRFLFMRFGSFIPADQRPQTIEQNGGKSTTGALDLIKIGSTVEVRIVDLWIFLV